MTYFDEMLGKLVKSIDQYGKYCIDNLPEIEHLIIEILDIMFSPRQILRQIAMISVLQVTLLCFNSFDKIWNKLIMSLSEIGRKEEALLNKLKISITYEEWKVAAGELDALRGRDLWRNQDYSTLYDCKMLEKRISNTREMLRRGDVFDLMFRLRGGLARDQFGMQHEGLFSRAMQGTKLIVERYLETMSASLNFICDSPIADEEIPNDAKLAFFNETRHSFGRTALLLSGGAYLGFYHLGVVKALWEQGLLPRVISGASAGSIMTAIIGTRSDEDFSQFCTLKNGKLVFPEGMRLDFFRYSEELKSEMARKCNYFVPQGLRWITFPLFSYIFDKKVLNLDTEHLKMCLISNCGHLTFQEAFDRTGKIINITVAPLNNYDPPRLLNYLTAPHVCVWSAAAASCALPGIFDSVQLVVKEPDGQFRHENEWTRKALVDNEDIKAANLASYSDGSLENDLPMQQLAELLNVNHFIVSQVNPHSAILSSMGATIWSNPIYNTMVGYLRFLTAQCRDWVKNVVNLFIFRSTAPIWSTRRGFTQTLTQDYEGRSVDITINPWSGHISSFQALKLAIHNPLEDEYLEAIHAAEVNTWPHIPRIRAHCLIEMTLDHCVQRLRKRLSDESQVVHEAALKNTISGINNDNNNNFIGMLRKKDSFYTTQSLVNLSGLSVSDPAPISAWHPVQDSNNLMFTRSDSRDTVNNLSDKQRHHSKDSSICQMDQSADHLDVLSDEDFLTLNVEGGVIPLANYNSSEEGISGTSARRNSTSHGSLKDDAIIHKSTNMANFYYKKSHSSEQLNSISNNNNISNKGL